MAAREELSKDTVGWGRQWASRERRTPREPERGLAAQARRRRDRGERQRRGQSFALPGTRQGGRGGAGRGAGHWTQVWGGQCRPGHVEALRDSRSGDQGRGPHPCPGLAQPCLGVSRHTSILPSSVSPFTLEAWLHTSGRGVT